VEDRRLRKENRGWRWGTEAIVFCFATNKNFKQTNIQTNHRS